MNGDKLYFPKYGCEDWVHHNKIIYGDETDTPRLPVP